MNTSTYWDSMPITEKTVTNQMPLALAPTHTPLQVLQIKGQPELIKRLSSMGVKINTLLQVVQLEGTNLILGIDSTRIAISLGVAQRITVTPK